MQRGAKPDALARLHELAVRHGTDEQREHLNRITAGVAPGEFHKPLEHGYYLAQVTGILFERLFKEVAEIRAIARGLMELDSSGVKPAPRGRPRGRPPKAREQEAS